MSAVQRRVVSWVPAVLWATLIFVLSSQPVLPSPEELSDKHLHAIAYGVLASLCLVGLTAARWRSITLGSVVAAFAVAVLYGISDEVHQSFVPGRTPDVADVVADAVGAALALAAAWAWAILLGRRSSALRP